MKIIVTGTPGTGKSTLAKKLAKKLGYGLVDVNKLVTKRKLWHGKDEWGAKLVKMKELERALAEELEEKEDAIVEGHLACEFPVPEIALVIVMRCEPSVLEKRMKKRKYPAGKVKNNLMAEMLDYCTQKSQIRHANVYEVETSGTAKKALADMEAIVAGKGAKFKAGWVDWSDKLFEEV